MTEQSAKRIWEEYSRGRRYNEAIHLYDNVQKCEDFFIGRQWKGAKITELDTPVINILQRVVNFFVSNIVSDDIGIHLETFDDSEEEKIPVGVVDLELGQDDRPMATTKAVIDMVDRQMDLIMELTKFRQLQRKLLRDAAVDGDGCLHFWFDNADLQGIRNGSTPGNIKAEIIPNHMVIFGNTESTEVERQPYIILEMRKSVHEVKELARENGCEDWESIQPDNESRGVNVDHEDGKVTLLRKYWKDRQTGTVWWMESTENVIITEPTDSMLTLYPVVWLPWEEVKNEYHGMGTIESLMSNQLFINKLYAMAGYAIKNTAFSKVIYDRTKLPGGWSNRVGEAIPVYGPPNEAVATSFKQADMSNQVFQMLQQFMSDTMNTMGSSDASLGNVNPQNTSAIIATQKATAMPLELKKRAFYDRIEDCVRIWMDMMSASYGVREVKIDIQPEAEIIGTDPMTGLPMMGEEKAPESRRILFNFEDLKEMGLKLNVEIGASTYWSDITQIQTAENLYTTGIITDKEVFLDCIPNGIVKNKAAVVKNIQEDKEQAEQMAMAAEEMAAAEQMPAQNSYSGLADAVAGQTM